MLFRNSFLVRAGAPAVAEFHRRTSNLPALTPPPILVRGLDAPAFIEEGDEMGFTLWFGPVPVRWEARFENVSEQGFTDRMLKGPFRTWIHTHRFEPQGDRTEILDEIEYTLRLHPLYGPIGLGMALGLPLLLAYRAWRTRRLLAALERAAVEADA